MPQYKWKGINLLGQIKSGILRASTVEVLRQELLSQDIGLLSFEEKSISSCKVNDKDLLFFFQRLQSLLSSGVYLHDALSLFAVKIQGAFFAHILEDVAVAVEQGALLHEALLRHPRVFESLMVEMCKVGGEGGMEIALQMMCEYLEQRNTFKKKLQQAAFMPFITSMFFLFIFISVLIFIIPRFADIFISMHVTVPTFTQWLISLSNCIQNTSSIYFSALVLGCVVLVRSLACTRAGITFFHAVQLKIPFWRYFVIERDKILFFNALGLLLQSHVPLIRSLKCVNNVVQNTLLKRDLSALLEFVHSGARLSDAMGQLAFIDSEIISLLEVGERSGKLGSLILEAGRVCKDRLLTRIAFLTTIIQPLLLIVLACGVAGLLLAVYLPLLTLSFAIA